MLQLRPIVWDGAELLSPGRQSWESEMQDFLLSAVGRANSTKRKERANKSSGPGKQSLHGQGNHQQARCNCLIHSKNYQVAYQTVYQVAYWDTKWYDLFALKVAQNDI
jgi:hypothetical protein